MARGPSGRSCRRKRCLASAWQILHGADGAASRVEHAFNTALASIDAIYAVEHMNAHNVDAASPAAVQEWEKHGALQGFAAGT